MSDERIIESTFWWMILVQTLGAVDLPGKGPRRMPAPRVYAAVVIVWTVLRFAAGTGWAKPASRLALLLLLTGTVLGPFGKRLAGFFTSAGYALEPQTVGSGLSGIGAAVAGAATPRGARPRGTMPGAPAHGGTFGSTAPQAPGTTPTAPSQVVIPGTTFA